MILTLFCFSVIVSDPPWIIFPLRALRLWIRASEWVILTLYPTPPRPVRTMFSHPFGVGAVASGGPLFDQSSLSSLSCDSSALFSGSSRLAFYSRIFLRPPVFLQAFPDFCGKGHPSVRFQHSPPGGLPVFLQPDSALEPTCNVRTHLLSSRSVFNAL